MKKSVLFMAAAAMFCCSCSSVITNTASTKNVESQLINRTTAELKISDKRVSYTLNPTKAQQKAGLSSVKAAAVAALLQANGNADVLIAPEFEIKKGLTSIKYVTVSGKPATYVNAHATTQAEANIVNTLKYPQPCK